MQQTPKIFWTLLIIGIIGFAYVDFKFNALSNSISDLKKSDVSYLNYFCKHKYPGVQDYLDKLNPQENKNEQLDFLFYSPSEESCLYVSTLEEAPAFMPTGKIRTRNIGNPSTGVVFFSLPIDNEGTWRDEYLIEFNKLSQVNQAELDKSMKIEW